MRSAIYAVVIIVMIGSCLVAITANNNALEVQQHLDQERYTRMVAEENMQKSEAQIKSLKDNLENTQKKLSEANGKIQSIQSIVSETEGLKAQLETVTHLKNSLEQKVQDLQNQPPVAEPLPTQKAKMGQ